MLDQHPKFIVSVGNTINKNRFLLLLGLEKNPPQLAEIKIGYNSGRGTFSKIRFYRYNELLFAVTPFFSARWSMPQKDVRLFVEKMNGLINS